MEINRNHYMSKYYVMFKATSSIKWIPVNALPGKEIIRYPKKKKLVLIYHNEATACIMALV